MSQWTMSTAGSRRPPMSNVSAILPLVREPCDTTVAGVPVGGDVGRTVGRGEGRGVEPGVGLGGPSVGPGVPVGTGVSPGPGLGVGGLFSSTTTPGMIARTQPASMRFGSYAGDS